MALATLLLGVWCIFVISGCLTQGTKRKLVVGSSSSSDDDIDPAMGLQAQARRNPAAGSLGHVGRRAPPKKISEAAGNMPSSIGHCFLCWDRLLTLCLLLMQEPLRIPPKSTQAPKPPRPQVSACPGWSYAIERLQLAPSLPLLCATLVFTGPARVVGGIEVTL